MTKILPSDTAYPFVSIFNREPETLIESIEIINYCMMLSSLLQCHSLKMAIGQYSVANIHNNVNSFCVVHVYFYLNQNNFLNCDLLSF